MPPRTARISVRAGHGYPGTAGQGSAAGTGRRPAGRTWGCSAGRAAGSPGRSVSGGFRFSFALGPRPAGERGICARLMRGEQLSLRSSQRLAGFFLPCLPACPKAERRLRRARKPQGGIPTCSFWPPPRSGEQGGECRGGWVLRGVVDGDSLARGFFCRALQDLPQAKQLALSTVPCNAVHREFVYSVLRTVNHRMH